MYTEQPLNLCKNERSDRVSATKSVRQLDVARTQSFGRRSARGTRFDIVTVLYSDGATVRDATAANFWQSIAVWIDGYLYPAHE
jgi:hypothetical protein